MSIDPRPTESAAPPAEAPTQVPAPGNPASETATVLQPAPNPAEAATLVPLAARATVTPRAAEVDATALEVDLNAGILGPYRELRPLRAWKHGMVYAAVHPLLRRRVLLRVLAAEHAATPLREEFLRVGRAVAALHHSNVAGGLLEAAAHSNVVFVASEEPAGQPLDGFLPRTRQERRAEFLYPNQALAQAMLQTASGLEAIHRAGLTHGHLSPSCLRHLDHGVVAIIGLGEDPPDNAPAPDSPAELARDPVQKDVFDLGMTFAQLVTGVQPRLAGSTRKGKVAHRLRRLNPGLSRALADLIERCLTTDPARRVKDARQLAKLLEPLTFVKVERASWSARILTQLYDAPMTLYLAATVGVCLLWVMSPGPRSGRQQEPGAFPGVLTLLAWLLAGLFITYAGWETLFGWTPGRRFGGLRLADFSGDRPPRLWLLLRALIRFAFVAAGLGLLGLLAKALPLPDVEGLSIIPLVIAFAGGPVLAALGLYLVALRLPGRLPPHDLLTGITWCIRPRRRALRYVETTAKVIAVRPAQPTPLPQSSAPILAAGRMDQYELRERLGEGGMGTVYAADDTTLGRRVALKVLSAAREDNALLLRRFEREARLAAQLSHPNVARVYGFGQVEAKPYMVMEFIQGSTLQQVVQRDGALPLAKAWDYIRQAALALREAARLGIVHRDIKPANLMLSAEGAVKVTDFGISRAVGEYEPEAAGSVGTPAAKECSLTRTGALLGTPMYMSPEQARGESLDSGSDIYSLGLTLYFLLAGREPYASGDMYDLVVRQCGEDPPALDGKVPDLTTERAAVLRRMIAKDKNARFDDYDTLLRALDETAPRPAVLASFAQRGRAEAVNFLILILVAGLVGLAARMVGLPPAVMSFACALAAALVYVLGIGWYGQTPGKWLLGLKVIRPGHGTVGIGHALLRFAGLYALLWWHELLDGFVAAGWMTWPPAVLAIGTAVTNIGYVVFGVSVVLIIFTKRRRGLHDLLAGTVVVAMPRRERKKPHR